MIPTPSSYFPANSFWSKVLKIQQNHPIDSEHFFGQITALEMNSQNICVRKANGHTVFIFITDIDDIPGVEQLTHVRSLSLSLMLSDTAHYAKKNRLLHLFSALPQVESLSLEFICVNQPTQRDLQFLQLYLPMAAKVKELHIRVSVPGGDSIADPILSLLPSDLPYLQHLHLSCSVQWQTLLAHRFPELKKLTVEGCIQNLPSLEKLGSHLPGLEGLSLGFFAAEKESSSRDASKTLSNLRTFILGGGEMTSLKPLSCSPLECLELSKVEFDPTGLLELEKLHDLVLNDCILTRPLPPLAPLHYLERLELYEYVLSNLDIVKEMSGLRILKVEAVFLSVYMNQDGQWPAGLEALETLSGLLELTVDKNVYDALTHCQTFMQRFILVNQDLCSPCSSPPQVLLRR